MLLKTCEVDNFQGKKHIIYSRRHLRYSVRKSMHLKALIQIYSIFLELGIRIILMPMCTLHKPCELFNFTPLFSLVRWILFLAGRMGLVRDVNLVAESVLTACEFRWGSWGQSDWGSRYWGAHVPGHFPSPAYVSSLASPPTAFLRSSNLLNWVQGCGQQNKKCFIYFLTGF